MKKIRWKNEKRKKKEKNTEYGKTTIYAPNCTVPYKVYSTVHFCKLQYMYQSVRYRTFLFI